MSRVQHVAQDACSAGQVRRRQGCRKSVAVPASALRMFLQVLTQMSQGNAITPNGHHFWRRRLPEGRFRFLEVVVEGLSLLVEGR